MSGPQPPRRPVPDRRAALGGLVGAALAAAVPARAQLVLGGEASRLAPRAADLDYSPPADLASLHDLYSRMTVPVGVDGAAPLPFVVDTGANQSVISLEQAARLGLKLGPPQLVHGAAGAAEAPTVVVDALTLGGRVERAVTLSALPEEALGCPGLLGVDRLEGRQLVLDFAHARMRIADRNQVRPEAEEVVMRARRRSGKLTLLDVDAGGLRALAFIDSGAQTSIGNMALKALRARRSPAAVWFAAAVVGVTGQTLPGEVSVLPELRVGEVSFRGLAVVYADLHVFDLWSATRAPALLLGMDVLSRFSRVTVDFARDQVRLLAPRAAA